MDHVQPILPGASRQISRRQPQQRDRGALAINSPTMNNNRGLTACYSTIVSLGMVVSFTGAGTAHCQLGGLFVRLHCGTMEILYGNCSMIYLRSAGYRLDQ